MSDNDTELFFHLKLSLHKLTMELPYNLIFL